MRCTFLHYGGIGIPLGSEGAGDSWRFFNNCAIQRFVDVSSLRQTANVLSFS